MWCAAHPNVRPGNVVQNWYARHVSPKNERLSCRATLKRFFASKLGSMADAFFRSLRLSPLYPMTGPGRLTPATHLPCQLLSIAARREQRRSKFTTPHGCHAQPALSSRLPCVPPHVWS